MAAALVGTVARSMPQQQPVQRFFALMILATSVAAQKLGQTLCTGRRLGRGRPLLPPMPAACGQMTDADLQTLAPVRKRVPAPLAPVGR